MSNGKVKMFRCKGPCNRVLALGAYGRVARDGKWYRRGSCKDCHQSRQPLPRDRRTGEVKLPPVPPLQATLDAYHRAESQRDMTKENRALIGELKRTKKLVEELTTGLKAPQVILYKKASWERADSTCIANFSDWHCDEPVDKDAVHGVNEYNLDIAKSRAEHAFKHALKLTDKEAHDARVRTLVVNLLGDFFSNWIHEELIANTLLAPGDAMLFVRGLLVSGIEFLLRESEYELEFNCVPGNHGRMTDKMHHGDPGGTSLETVMYATIADYFRGEKRVRFHNPGHAMVYRTYFEKFVVRLIHGYEIGYSGGVGGVTIPLNKAMAQWDILKRADLTIYGHFHQYNPGPRSLGNGSLIGYNTFAQLIKAAYEEAQQSLVVVHARNGGTRAGVYPIWLDDRHQEPKKKAEQQRRRDDSPLS